ncbi:hypothetical protein CRM22_005372 [Opisthorchis felineus]|uniref:Uncharacterized protein n=1 Tax=Opisthorchis felineus TaxID=147828 RepID=A0A4S2LX73_OPIFE|nr:hypothetical protein CRM22_005372 [Opisthorchis felineus]
MSNAALSLRCHDYHVLVIDTTLPEKCLTDEFLFSLDTIVLLQWSVKTDALLAHLLSQIWKRIHHMKSPGAFHTSNFGIVRLCCLIIPRLRGRFSVNESSKPGRMRRTCHLPHSLYLAEQLGINVLQIGRSAHDVKMDTFGTQQRCPCLQSSLALHHHDFNCTRTVNDRMHASDNLGPKKRFINRIQLYQKLGTGSLEMRPIFPVHAGGAYRFDALFVWYSETNSRDSSRQPLNQTKILLYCANNDPSLQKIHHPYEPPDNVAVKRLSTLFRQLTLHSCSVRSVNSTKPAPQTNLRKRNGIPQSHTFTAGFDRQRARTLTNVTCIKSKLKSNLKLGLKTPAVVGAGNGVPGRMAVSCIEDLEGADVHGKRMWIPPACSMSMIEDRTETTTDERNSGAGSILDVQELPFERETDPAHTPGPNYLSNSIVSGANKSVLQDSRFQSQQWTDNQDRVEAFSATVLLAIPEAGEADYYSDSPQYLTVAELRELGIYDDDEDDEDEEEGEDLDVKAQSVEDDRDSPSDSRAHCLCSDIVDMTKSEILEKNHRFSFPSLNPLTSQRGLHFTASDELVSLVSSTTL